MLGWALAFLVIAITAAIFGFGGIAAGAASIAQILFFLFFVLFVISPIVVRMQGPSVRYSGTFVSEPLFAEIQAGRTSAAWVLAAFSEPDRRAAAPEGGECWVWAYLLAAVQGSMVGPRATRGR